MEQTTGGTVHTASKRVTKATDGKFDTDNTLSVNILESQNMLYDERQDGNGRR